jgi:Protein of unknown function (DUF1566)
LPRALSKLTRRQAIEISHTGFHSDVDRLIRGLERILPSEKTKPEQAATRRGTADADSEAIGARPVATPVRTGFTKEVPEGVYLDPKTKLMWTIADNGKDIHWHEANEYAKQLRLGGFSDWRLPTIEELEKLYDLKGSGEYNIRKPFALTGAWVWSSTKEGSDSAWDFNFLFGERHRYLLGPSYNARALCVRGPGE